MVSKLELFWMLKEAVANDEIPDMFGDKAKELIRTKIIIPEVELTQFMYSFRYKWKRLHSTQYFLCKEHVWLNNKKYPPKEEVGMQSHDEVDQSESLPPFKNRYHGETKVRKEYIGGQRKENSYKCDFCKKSHSYNFSSPDRVHKVKPLKCVSCQESFSQLSELRDHTSKHITETRTRIRKVFKCDHCEETFFLEYRWKIHKRSHIKDKPQKDLHETESVIRNRKDSDLCNSIILKEEEIDISDNDELEENDNITDIKDELIDLSVDIEGRDATTTVKEENVHLSDEDDKANITLVKEESINFVLDEAGNMTIVKEEVENVKEEMAEDPLELDTGELTQDW